MLNLFSSGAPFSPEKRLDSRYISNSGATQLVTASNTSKRLWMEIFLIRTKCESNRISYRITYQMTYAHLVVTRQRNFMNHMCLCCRHKKNWFAHWLFTEANRSLFARERNICRWSISEETFDLKKCYLAE